MCPPSQSDGLLSVVLRRSFVCIDIYRIRNNAIWHRYCADQLCGVLTCFSICCGMGKCHKETKQRIQCRVLQPYAVVRHFSPFLCNRIPYSSAKLRLCYGALLDAFSSCSWLCSCTRRNYNSATRHRSGDDPLYAVVDCFLLCTYICTSRIDATKLRCCDATPYAGVACSSASHCNCIRSNWIFFQIALPFYLLISCASSDLLEREHCNCYFKAAVQSTGKVVTSD